MGSNVTQLLKYFSVDKISTDVKTFFLVGTNIFRESEDVYRMRTFFFCTNIFKKNRATVWHAEKFLS